MKSSLVSGLHLSLDDSPFPFLDTPNTQNLLFHPNSLNMKFKHQVEGWEITFRISRNIQRTAEFISSEEADEK